jgi:hypothetical protein
MPENLAACKPVPARIPWTPENMACGTVWAMSSKPESDFRRALRMRLRAIQAEMKKSDSEMGKLTGVGRTTWGQWVGETGNKPAEEAMARLCGKAPINMDWLYRGKIDHLPLKLALRLELRIRGIDPDAATEEQRNSAAGLLATSV